jgi:hypothetical protein
LVTVGIWNRQRTVDEEFLSSDNQTFNAKLGLVDPGRGRREGGRRDGPGRVACTTTQPLPANKDHQLSSGRCPTHAAGDVYVRAGDHITDPRIADREAIAILEDNATALLGKTTATAEC